MQLPRHADAVPVRPGTHDRDAVQPPLATVHMSGGASTGRRRSTLPPVFGPTTIWLDDGHGSRAPTYATGVVADAVVPRPVHRRHPDAGERDGARRARRRRRSTNKNIVDPASRYGANGRLVVTSVFAQGYTVADVQCADDQRHAAVHVAGLRLRRGVLVQRAARTRTAASSSRARSIDGFAGGSQRVRRPDRDRVPADVRRTSVDCTTVDVNTAREPATAKFDPTWFTNKINFERNEAGAIEVDNANVCPLDADYTTFKQWKLDPAGVGGDCCDGKNVINVDHRRVVQARLDPPTLVGKTFPKVVGILRPINIGSFNVWIIYPRSTRT